jgi:hypothetical protein
MKRYLKNIGLGCILTAGALFLTHCGSGGGNNGVTAQGAGQPAVAMSAQVQQPVASQVPGPAPIAIGANSSNTTAQQSVAAPMQSNPSAAAMPAQVQQPVASQSVGLAAVPNGASSAPAPLQHVVEQPPRHAHQGQSGEPVQADE